MESSQHYKQMLNDFIPHIAFHITRYELERNSSYYRLYPFLEKTLCFQRRPNPESDKDFVVPTYALTSVKI